MFTCLRVHTAITVIAVESAITYSFVKKVCERGERVNTSIKAMQIDPFASSVCQSADSYNNNYYLLLKQILF